jgi:aspartyl-tRNA(Asn)/glutamyl-tRNA(Gln) amidotransferase subunit A
MLENFTIESLIQGYKDNKFSVSEVVSDYYDRIAKVNSDYNVYVSLCRDLAEQRVSKISEYNIDKDLLYGVPLGLKDLFSYKDSSLTAGSKILKGFKPSYNAVSTQRILDQGGIVLGMVNTDEFACGASNETSAYGPVHNPYDREYVSGGSSGGSAALIPLNLGVFATGSDTGGSIRQPASFCNAVGLKPTYGRIPRAGVIPMSSSLDTVGHMTKTVMDSAIVLQAMAGADKKDSTSPNVPVDDYTSYVHKGVKGMKIGIPKEYFTDVNDPEVISQVMKSIDVLKAQGAEIVEISLPYTKYGVAVYYIVSPCELSTNMERYDGVRYGNFQKDDINNLFEYYTKSRGQGLGVEILRRIMVGTFCLSSESYEAYYLKAQKVRTLLIEDFKNAFSKVDLIAGPVSPTAAFKLNSKANNPLEMYQCDALTIPSNCAGIPGISVPAGFTNTGLPVGLQLLAPHFMEGKLFSAAQVVENEFKCFSQVPSL